MLGYMLLPPFLAYLMLFAVSFVAKLKFLPLGNGEFPRGTHFLTTEEVAENESRKDGC